jgi:NitT/TauT family transport system substrate-binding protein
LYGRSIRPHEHPHPDRQTQCPAGRGDHRRGRQARSPPGHLTIRQIAEEAGVPLALVGYYFGPKHELFHAIFEHWSHTIQERLTRLAEVNNDPDDACTLPRIIEAFTTPVLALRASAEGEYYALLVARELYHATEEADRVLRGYFDPLAAAYIDALHVALPHATRAQVAWGYQFALGALLHHLNDSRIERLSRGENKRADPAVAPMLVNFIVGGLRAALPKPKTPAHTTENPHPETEDMMKRRTLLSALAAASASAALPSRAQQSHPKIVFGYTAVTDFASVFVAAEEGYFKKRGLDVEPKFIPLNSTIPAALQSDSLQIGGPTPSVFLQAVDGGLDLVLVAGGGLTSKKITGFGLVARAGSGIKTAQDCVGKKIGVPGLGAFLHVTFRAWLKDSGVDYRKVNFVEASFPQHADLLRGGSVDAVVSADPFMSRITESGAGYVASYYSTFLPENNQTIVCMRPSANGWQKNPATARAFREALVESGGFMQQAKNDAKVRDGHRQVHQAAARGAGQGAGLAARPGRHRQAADGYWTRLMKEQDMLKTNIDVANLIASDFLTRPDHRARRAFK